MQNPSDRRETVLSILLGVMLDTGIIPVEKDDKAATTMTAEVGTMYAGLHLKTICPCGCGSTWAGDVDPDGIVILIRSDIATKKPVVSDWWKG